MKDLKDALIVEQFVKYVEDHVREEIKKSNAFLSGTYLKLQHADGKEEGKPVFGFIPIMPGMFTGQAGKELYREGIQQVVDNVSILSPGSAVLVSIMVHEVFYIKRTMDQIPDGDYTKVEKPSEAKDRVEGLMFSIETSTYQQNKLYKLIRDDKEKLLDFSQDTFEKMMSSREDDKSEICGLFSNILYKPEKYYENLTPEQKALRDRFGAIVDMGDDFLGGD